MSAGNIDNVPGIDDGLAELLDSALSDFKTSDTPSSVMKSSAENAAAAPQTSSKKSAKNQSTESKATPSSRSASNQDDDIANLNRILGGFTSASSNTGEHDMDAQFGTLMEILKREDPTLFNKFRTLNERASTLDDESSEADFANVLQDTLTYLNEGLREDPDSSLGRSSASTAANRDCGEDGENLQQFVDSASEMMRSLLSRSVFYPVIESLTTKYPDWLTANRGQMDAADFEKHKRQFTALRRIREVYERSSDKSEVLSTADFDAVIESLREAQSYGDPPSAILDQAGAAAFNTLGQNSCSVM